MTKSNKSINKSLVPILLLYLLALLPIVTKNSSFFPYVTGKILLIRSVISIVSAYFILCLLVKDSFREEIISKIRVLSKNKLFISVIIYFAFYVLSTVFAVDKFTAFFGTAERGEGLIGMSFFFGFLFFTLLLFKKNNWLNFFKISLFITNILFAIEIFQIIKNPQDTNLFIGNIEYLAAYFLFSLTISAIIFFNNKREKGHVIWSIISIVTFINSILGIFLTHKRGILVGIVVGLCIVIFYIGFSVKKFRKTSGLLLGGICILIAIFLGTHNNSFWQKVPLFNRLSTISLQDDSTFARVYLLETAFRSINPAKNGVKKFLFGWGPEGFLIASNKYYDPKAYGIYEGAMYDRVHNQLMDVFVANGLLGFLSFTLVWFFIFKSILPIRDFKERLIFVFFATSYFIQNLFTFDNIITYMLFFSLISFTICMENENVT